MITITPNSTGLDQVISCSVPVKMLKIKPTYMKLINESDLKRTYISTGLNDEGVTLGWVLSLEGPAEMKLGYWLCRGVKGEYWVMTPDEKTENKVRHPEHPLDDAEGWGIYLNTKPVFAIEMNQPFKVENYEGKLLTGKTGDFLLYQEDRKSTWLCDHDILEDTYVTVKW